MSSDERASPDALRAYLRERFADPSLEVADRERLSGGAIQENLALTLVREGGTRRDPLVLRTDAASGVSVSHSRAHEHALLRAAFEAGVAVPEPLLLCTDVSVTGAPFFLMRRVGGSANPVRLTRGDALEGTDREALVAALGEQLARIHAVPLDDPRLAFLHRDDGPSEPSEPSRADGVLAARVATYRGLLKALGAHRPVLDWALEWLSRQRLAPNERRLCHNDFRTGNLMIEAGEIRGVLDWEFAAAGDPHEDIGWFCAPCWRFAAREREAGGLGSREAFYAGYERASARRIDREAVPVWEIVATVRWAIIALQQGERFTSGAEPTLELGLTGRMIAGLELDLLLLVQRAAARGPRDGDAVGAAVRPNAAAAIDAGAEVATDGETGAAIDAGARDAPGGAALLAAARTALLEELLPHLPGERRYPALMIANAIGIASRELVRAEEDGTVGGKRGGGRAAADAADVPALGRIDGSTALFAPALLARLRDEVHRRLAIADPGRLDARGGA